MSKSKHPRTDKVWRIITRSNFVVDSMMYVRDHANRLEEELAAMTTECNRLREFEITAEQADKELAEEKALLDKLEAMTVSKNKAVEVLRKAQKTTIYTIGPTAKRLVDAALKELEKK
jgi:hypothetical protein